MKKIRCRVEIYPKETIVPGIRIRIPQSFIKRVAKCKSVYPQLFIRTKGLEKEFKIQHLVIAVDNDFFLSSGKEKHNIVTSAHGEKKIVDDVYGELDSDLD